MWLLRRRRVVQKEYVADVRRRRERPRKLVALRRRAVGDHVLRAVRERIDAAGCDVDDFQVRAATLGRDDGDLSAVRGPYDRLAILPARRGLIATDAAGD